MLSKYPALPTGLPRQAEGHRLGAALVDNRTIPASLAAVGALRGWQNLKKLNDGRVAEEWRCGQYCKKCGGHLMTNHPPLGLVDVFAPTLPTLKFKPGVHVNYAETVLPIRDGLPKFKDFPAEFGESGEQIAE
jgi:hypothetical protein